MRESPEVRWIKSPAGMATVVGLSVAALVGAVTWVRRAQGEERRDRQAVLASAVGGTALSLGFVELAKRRGWIEGPYVELPMAVQWLWTVPYSIGVFTAWVAGYRWLTEGSRHPWAIGGLVTAGLVPATIVGEKWEIERGYFRLGNGWRIGYNAAAAAPLMLAPVAMYEGLKRLAPPERPEHVWADACAGGSCAPVGV